MGYVNSYLWKGMGIYEAEKNESDFVQPDTACVTACGSLLFFGISGGYSDHSWNGCDCAGCRVYDIGFCIVYEWR